MTKTIMYYLYRLTEVE